MHRTHLAHHIARRYWNRILFGSIASRKRRINYRAAELSRYSFWNKERQWLRFAEHEGELIGVVGAYVDDAENTRHRAQIVAVYIQPHMRAKGIARALVEQLIEDIHIDPTILALDLDVTAGNTAAEKLYASLGFKEIGYIEKEMCVDGVYYDNRIMTKFIR